MQQINVHKTRKNYDNNNDDDDDGGGGRDGL
jgi:hypothetical protein